VLKYRNDTFIGSTDPVDPGPNPHINDNGKGTNVVVNTLYRGFNSSANGDGFTNQANNAYFQSSVGGAVPCPIFANCLHFLLKKGKREWATSVEIAND
jgi:hypothetical protein